MADELTAETVFHRELTVEEKIDGACVGIRHTGDEPIIRNREHILRKGYLKDTPAKMQFRPLWGYYYEHRENFAALNTLLLADRHKLDWYGGNRWDEIKHWLDGHPEVTHWAVLEDALVEDIPPENLVRTTLKLGLTREGVERAVAILTGV